MIAKRVENRRHRESGIPPSNTRIEHLLPPTLRPLCQVHSRADVPH